MWYKQFSWLLPISLQSIVKILLCFTDLFLKIIASSLALTSYHSCLAMSDVVSEVYGAVSVILSLMFSCHPSGATTSPVVILCQCSLIITFILKSNTLEIIFSLLHISVAHIKVALCVLNIINWGMLKICPFIYLKSKHPAWQKFLFQIFHVFHAAFNIVCGNIHCTYPEHIIHIAF